MVTPFLDLLRDDRELAPRVVGWHVRKARPGSWAEFPQSVPESLRSVLRGRGIDRPYEHQAAAWRAVDAGRHAVIVTPTASGKSACYNVPVLSGILGASPGKRPAALYLFPTKALSQDQVAELNALLEALEQAKALPAPVGAWTYDGDTPPDIRRVLREQGDIVVTNPYMLHVGILPHHMRWGSFFRRLRYVVIDELHVYRGVLGSAVANLIRRLKRVARHYGSDPVFIACSATSRNPAEHFRRLVEEDPVLIDRSGAPRSERHHLFWNPPLLNPALGLRARAVDEVRAIGRHLMRLGVPSIVFGRSRNTVEVITKYLKDLAPDCGLRSEQVVGYRGGYLPDLRRRIETGLRAGEIRMVAATNALELGVDIGSLDAVVMTGYPGAVASYHQQSGRAGRRSGVSVSLMVGRSEPLDQYVLADPAFVLDGAGEEAVTNPDNLVIATNHLKCAAFELPFEKGEGLGSFPHTGEVLDLLSGPEGMLLEREGRYHWMADTYPAEEVSLDAVESDCFLVLDEEHGTSLGHVDRPSAITSLYPCAIYQHQGEQYQVKTLDWGGRRAYARKVDVDYYTEAEVNTDVQVLQEDGGVTGRLGVLGHGDVHVSHLATLYKRIRFYSNENLETGPIDLPPEELDTMAFWIAFSPELERLVRLADGTRAGAVGGLAHLLRGVVPLFLRAGPGDLRARGFACHAHFLAPTVMLYEAVPGGVGISRELHQHRMAVLEAARETLTRCPCRVGCPGCIGISAERGAAARAAARDVLDHLLEEPEAAWEPSAGVVAET